MQINYTLQALRKKANMQLGENMGKYFDKCVDICWKAIVQDPPLILNDSCKTGDRFNKSQYRDFTVRGPSVAYLVCLYNIHLGFFVNWQ